MKLKVTESAVSHRDGDTTDYIELYIGYDFDEEVYMTIRRYPKNTIMKVFYHGQSITIKEAHTDFLVMTWFDRACAMFDLVYSDRQRLAIYERYYTHIYHK